jgi:hypothetical protein
LTYESRHGHNKKKDKLFIVFLKKGADGCFKKSHLRPPLETVIGIIFFDVYRNFSLACRLIICCLLYEKCDTQEPDSRH